MKQADLDILSPLSWAISHSLLNETQKPIEFHNHRFLIQPFADLHPDQVVMKSAQIGFSVTAILKSLWLAKYYGLNIIYALPTNDIIKGFVQPKVDALITSNPDLKKLLTTDSMSLKQVGERFIHFKGTGSQREAISTSADLLVVDEYDRSLDMNVVNTFDSRLQASEYAWRWRFSNPSGIGFGVDALYQDSDQMHWFVTCPKCNHEWFMDWEPNDSCHFIDRESREYLCGKCRAVLSTATRINGRWVAKYPTRAYRRGYWISQLMAPWVSADRIIDQYDESGIEFFHQFVLGKAYTPTDLIVNRETILRACAPSLIPKVQVVMGVDQDASGQYWVAMTPQGVFAYGKTTSWEELEHIKLTYQATVVCDPAPFPTMPKRMAEKYPDWYLCYFKESKSLNIIEWKNSIVYADRTRLLDTVATEIAGAKLLFRQRPSELEEYIRDWANIYRTTVEESDGRTKSSWLKKENRNSDYSFATAYARVALSRMLAASGSTFLDPHLPMPDNITDVTGLKEGTSSTLGSAVKDTLSGL
jgi:hypothetical protein